MENLDNSGISPVVVPADSTPAVENPPVNIVADSGTTTPPEGTDASVTPTAPVIPPVVEPTEAEKRIRKLVAQKKDEEKLRIKEQGEKEYWRGVAEGRVTSKPADSNPPGTSDVPPAQPNIDKFETYEEYEQAKDKYLISQAKWEIKQDAAKEEAKRKEEGEKNKQQTERQRVVQNWTNQRALAQDKYPDFETTVADPSFVQTAVTSFLIQESEVAGDLAYYLAKNPAEMAKLNNLPPHKAAKALGVLERKFTSSTPAARNVLSQAPAPITPVQSGGGAINEDESNLPMDEYVRRRNRKQGLIK
jgi:hypothetical protein